MSTPFFHVIIGFWFIIIMISSHRHMYTSTNMIMSMNMIKKTMIFIKSSTGMITFRYSDMKKNKEKLMNIDLYVDIIYQQLKTDFRSENILFESKVFEFTVVITLNLTPGTDKCITTLKEIKVVLRYDTSKWMVVEIISPHYSILL